MAKAKILIVEDESIVARDIQRRLNHLGYDVVGAVPTGEEAIKKSSILLPDLVLMDVRLKGEIDGIEAATEIRFRYNIPTIYLSAYADNDTLKRASVTEPYGYILKPFEERELHTTIEMALYRHELERKIKENETWYGTTLRSLGEAVIATDANGSIKFMNATAESMTGWKLSEAQGQDLLKVFQTADDQSKSRSSNPVDQILRNKVTAVLKNHATLISRDGREFPIDESASPIKDERGSTVGVVLVFQDVSERKRAQEALRTSQEYAENIIGSSMDMVIAVDLDRKIIEFNKAAEETFGYKKEEVLGNHINILYADVEAGAVVNRTVDAQGRVIMEIFNKRKNGEVFPCILASSVLRNARGEKIGFMGFSRDITGVKKAEETLRSAQEYAQNIVDSSLDMIIAVDKDRLIVEFNKAAEDTFGYATKEVLGKHMNILYADPGEGDKVHNTTVMNGRCVQEVINRRKNGEIFTSLLSASVLSDGSGQTIGAMGVSRDITEMKKAEQASRESEERYKSIVELLPDPIVVHRKDKIFFVNSAALRSFAAESVDELIGRPFLDLVHPEFKVIVGERVRQMKEGIQIPPIEEKFIRLDGTILEAEVSEMSFVWHGIPAIQVVMRDLAERKRADQAIRASESKYRTLFENVLDGVYQTTPEGEILTTNPAFAQMLGYDSEAELLLINVHDIYENKDDRTKFLDVLEKEGQILNAEFTLRKKNGQHINVLENARVVKNKFGEILFFEGTVRDISELKNIQVALRKSEERFRTFAKHSVEAIWTLECETPIEINLPVGDVVRKFTESAYLSECNEVLAKAHGYQTAKEMVGIHLKEILNTSDIFNYDLIKQFIESGYQIENYESQSFDKDGNDKYYLYNIVGIVENEKLVRVWGTQLDITEQKRNRLLSGIAYRITRAIDTSYTLEEIYKEVHAILRDTISVKNFYIAFYDEKKDTISFPYYVDELASSEQPRKAKKGAIEYVLRTGKTLLLTPENVSKYEQKGENDFSDVRSRLWLGVPLILDNKPFGVMVAQNYSNTPVYTEAFRQIMKFVSAQISKAIDYKRTNDMLVKQEQMSRYFFDRSTIPHFIADKEGIIIEYNDAFKRIVESESKGKNQTQVKPLSLGSVKERKQFLARLEKEKKLERYEIELPTFQGKNKKVVIDALGTFDADGSLQRIHGSVER